VIYDLESDKVIIPTDEEELSIENSKKIKKVSRNVGKNTRRVFK
jgi:hypothetical protein